MRMMGFSSVVIGELMSDRCDQVPGRIMGNVVHDNITCVLSYLNVIMIIAL